MPFSSSSSSDGVTGSDPFFAFFDFELDPDFAEFVVSARSKLGIVASDCEKELRGLSVFWPGIFDLKPLKERADSLVSDLLNEG